MSGWFMLQFAIEKRGRDMNTAPRIAKHCLGTSHNLSFIRDHADWSLRFDEEKSE